MTTNSTHCVQGAKAKVQYSFDGEKQIVYETIGIVEITTDSEANNNPLIKYGSTATVPSDWVSGADVFLYGTWYSSTSGLPNCPTQYLEQLIGQTSAGATLTAIATPRANACSNAHTIKVPALNYDDFDRQWQGSGVNIALRNRSEICKITIESGEGYIFTRLGKCPINYEVICGDDCPEGSHKCTHNKYPGYCCVPCKEVGQRINNIANKVGR